MIDYLNSLPLAGLLLVITIGYVVGNRTFHGLSLGPAGATLFIALLLGQFGLQRGSLSLEESAGFSLGAFGFILFLYSVGFEAGPRFFASFRDRLGWKFAIVAATVNLVGVVVTFLLALFLDLGPDQAAGALAGSFTSAPIFAASLELAQDAPGLSVAFAVTYPVGLVGIVLLIQILPKIFQGRLASPIVTGHTPSAKDKRRIRYERGSPEIHRTLQVENREVIGRSLGDLHLPQRTGCLLTWVRRNEQTFLAAADTVLNKNDHIAAIGRVDELQALGDLLGKEVFDEQLEEALTTPRQIEVRASHAVGRTLAELQIAGRYRCVISRIERGRLWVEPGADVVVLRGDVLTVVGRADHVRELAQFMGKTQPRYEETDIAVYTVGMFLGVLIGDVEIPIAGMRIGLGNAGGLLFAGALMGWLNELGLLRANVPSQARQLVRDLGVLLFISETGLVAARSISVDSASSAFPMLVVGATAMSVSVITALLVALYLLRLEPIDAWGCVSGGLTSSAALHAVRRMSDSSESTAAYVAAFATSSVLATVTGRLIMRLLQ